MYCNCLAILFAKRTCLLWTYGDWYSWTLLSIGLRGSRMLIKRLQGCCILLLVFFLSNASGMCSVAFASVASRFFRTFFFSLLRFLTSRRNAVVDSFKLQNIRSVVYIRSLQLLAILFMSHLGETEICTTAFCV